MEKFKKVVLVLGIITMLISFGCIYYSMGNYQFGEVVQSNMDSQHRIHGELLRNEQLSVMLNKTTQDNLMVIREVLDQTLQYLIHMSVDFSANLIHPIYFWYIGLGLAFVSPLLLYFGINGRTKNVEAMFNAKVYPHIHRMWRFVLGKCLIWFLALLVAIGLISLSSLTPIEKPYSSVLLVVILGGYGFISWIYNSFGKLPGLKGTKAELPSFGKATKPLLTVLAIVAFWGLNILIRMSIGFDMILSVDYFVWYIIFTFVVALGFVWLNEDSVIINHSSNSVLWHIVWHVFKYLPFYIIIVIFVGIGSTNGLYTSIQGMLFLFYGIYTGKVVWELSHNMYLSSLMTALIIGFPTDVLI